MTAIAAALAIMAMTVAANRSGHLSTDGATFVLMMATALICYQLGRASK